MALKEAAVQARIKEQLEKAGWFVTKLIQTSTNGIPDLLCILSGRVIFIEVKSEKGKVSALQEYRIKKLRDQDIEVIITNNPKDIEYLCSSSLKPPKDTLEKEYQSSQLMTTRGRSSSGRNTKAD